MILEEIEQKEFVIVHCSLKMFNDNNDLTKDELNLSIVALGVVMEEFRKEYLEMFGGTPVNDVDIFGDED